MPVIASLRDMADIKACQQFLPIIYFFFFFLFTYSISCNQYSYTSYKYFALKASKERWELMRFGLLKDLNVVLDGSSF